jgi:hypothetical protein
MQRDYLTTPIQLLPEDQRTALGIFQSDIVVRTAVIAGLADIRESPALLDYVFASLPKDDLTYKIYGEEQVKIAKDWFLNTDIPVFMNTRIDESKVPCITIAVTSSNEDAQTLGDVHYQTVEMDKDESVIVYGGPFTPLNYVASTGCMTMKSTFDLEVFPGQLIKDKKGKSHEILDVLDPYTIVIEPNANSNFSGMYVVSAPQKRQVSVESVEFRESFEIGCHALGEPAFLTYLHSIVLFILLRYKEVLLEARGLTRTTISSGDVKINTSFVVSQPVFSRMITLNGYVHQYWPKFFVKPYIGINTEVDAETIANEEPRYTNRGVIPAAYPDINGPGET